ncbi:hypothetical protein L4D76_25360 [Photobacterium sagamiensis]|uniref:hypothetical protein n=1 Tax=Photobacterium sagamiensis TaxID=2910241 RepID=UPI003D130790
MLDFSNSQALKGKQTKATIAANILKIVILGELTELYSPAEIEILEQAQRLIEDGKNRVKLLKEKRLREEKQRKATEAGLHDKAQIRTLKALNSMSLADIYCLNVCYTYQLSAVNELIEEYDHKHYLATVQGWLDTEVATDSYVDKSPQEARNEWEQGIAKAAVEIISWPCLKHHRNYQEQSSGYIEPRGIPEDFPESIFTVVREKNMHRLSAPCLDVIEAIKAFEVNEEKVRLILNGLSQ